MTTEIIMRRTTLALALLAASASATASEFDYNYLTVGYGNIEFDEIEVDGDAIGIYQDTNPADGVPDRPVPDLLRGKTGFDIDDQGRVYRTKSYSVDPVLGGDPNNPGPALTSQNWFDRRGHMLKTVGKLQEGVAAYRKAIELKPELGEAWWSLANLKTIRFSDADIAAMRSALEKSGLRDQDRIHLEFALGKAMHDVAKWDDAFGHYRSGNALRLKQHPFDQDQIKSFGHLALARSVSGCPGLTVGVP